MENQELKTNNLELGQESEARDKLEDDNNRLQEEIQEITEERGKIICNVLILNR